LYVFLVSPMHSTYLASVILLELVIIVCGEENKLQSFLFCDGPVSTCFNMHPSCTRALWSTKYVKCVSEAEFAIPKLADHHNSHILYGLCSVNTLLAHSSVALWVLTSVFCSVLDLNHGILKKESWTSLLCDQWSAKSEVKTQTDDNALLLQGCCTP
jgi:hypothetical protein